MDSTCLKQQLNYSTSNVYFKNIDIGYLGFGYSISLNKPTEILIWIYYWNVQTKYILKGIFSYIIENMKWKIVLKIFIKCY